MLHFRGEEKWEHRRLKKNYSLITQGGLVVYRQGPEAGWV